MSKEHKLFNVNYQGWLDKSRRSYRSVKSIFTAEQAKVFDEFAEKAKCGDTISIGGVSIEHTPSDSNQSAVQRSY